MRSRTVRAYAEPRSGRYTVVGDTYRVRAELRDKEVGDGTWDPVSKVWRNVTETGVAQVGALKVYVVEVEGWCHMPGSVVTATEVDLNAGAVNLLCICDGRSGAKICRVLGPAIYGGGYDGG